MSCTLVSGYEFSHRQTCLKQSRMLRLIKIPAQTTITCYRQRGLSDRNYFALLEARRRCWPGRVLSEGSWLVCSSLLNVRSHDLFVFFFLRTLNLSHQSLVVSVNPYLQIGVRGVKVATYEFGEDTIQSIELSNLNF